MEIALVVSTISLLVSIATLYLTQLRSPSIASVVGPRIKVYYADYDEGGSLGLYLPVTFVNLATNAGIIFNAAITLHRKEFPQQRYFIQWREFQKLDTETDKWVFDEMAHAIVVSGKSAVSKNIWFMWNTDSDTKLLLREGPYMMNFFFWDQKEKPPRQEAHEFFITEYLLNTIEHYRQNKLNTTIEIILDKEYDVNKLMTEHEAKRLLGG